MDVWHGWVELPYIRNGSVIVMAAGCHMPYQLSCSMRSDERNLRGAPFKAQSTASRCTRRKKDTHSHTADTTRHTEANHSEAAEDIGLSRCWHR